jgi:NhaP-type Na+/H+ or K+/H+ antiporter
VLLGLLGTGTDRSQGALVAWFGIRGIGSLYYLMFALTHGLSGPAASHLVTLTLSVVAVSIVVHGISVTPLMVWYSQRTAR